MLKLTKILLVLIKKCIQLEMYVLEAFYKNISTIFIRISFLQLYSLNIKVILQKHTKKKQVQE